jgi:hypothetical protein
VPLTGTLPRAIYRQRYVNPRTPRGWSNASTQRRHFATVFESAGCLGPHWYEGSIITFGSPIAGISQAKSMTPSREPNRSAMIEHDNIRLSRVVVEKDCKNAAPILMISVRGNKHSRMSQPVSRSRTTAAVFDQSLFCEYISLMIMDKQILTCFICSQSCD